MKNIIFTAILFLGLQTIAQKRVTIVNNSPYDLKIGTIESAYTPGTNPPSYGFPTYSQQTWTPTSSNIIVPSGGSYILDNTSTVNFPFSSPASVPLITNWKRIVSGGGISTVTSATAYAAGAQQVFGNLKFELVDPVTGAVVGGQTLGTRRAGVFSGGTSNVSPGTGNYSYPYPASPTWNVSVSTVPAYNSATPNASYRTIFTFF